MKSNTRPQKIDRDARLNLPVESTQPEWVPWIMVGQLWLSLNRHGVVKVAEPIVVYLCSSLVAETVRALFH
eukprot:384461-Hanusia_phi.AAC.1